MDRKGGEVAIAEPKTRMVTCATCDGVGSYEVQHPRYGSPSCPEPSIEVRCEDCDGTGLEEVEVEPVTLDDLEEQGVGP